MITNRNTNAISCETKSPFHSVGTVTRKDDGRSTRDSNNAGSNPSLRMRKLSKTSTKFLITLRELLLLRRLLKQTTLDVTVAPTLVRILGQANPVCQDTNRLQLLIVGIIVLIVDHCHRTTATIAVAHTVAIVVHQVHVHTATATVLLSIGGLGR